MRKEKKEAIEDKLSTANARLKEIDDEIEDEEDTISDLEDQISDCNYNINQLQKEKDLILQNKTNGFIEKRITDSISKAQTKLDV